jgi:threonine/homoserine/homoserine lactone efflux protein
MLWLGSRLMLRAARNRRDPQSLEERPQSLEERPQSLAEPRAAAPRGVLRSWIRGLMTNLLNPKIGAFYVAVLPQFIPPHTPHLAVGLLLAFVHDVEGIIWFTAIILGSHAMRSLLERRSARRATDAITGATLIGFGVRLGLSSK